MSEFDDSVPESAFGYVRKSSPEGFDGLVENAIDFFQHAFRELSARPKSSLISFYTGLELMLKARLLHEHWALVVSKPERAVRSKFQDGDFQSVNLEECVSRLEDICGEKLRDEKECFDSIRRHRNRLVHFFHPSYPGKRKRKAVAQVAAEQFRAWMLLNRLLTDQWVLEFEKHSEAIGKLDKQIHKNRRFLDFKFKTLRTELQKYENSGGKIAICRSCQFLAAELTYRKPVQSSFCLVCNGRRDAIAMQCPECDDEMIECSDGGGSCASCDTSVGIAELLDEFGPGRYYCADCERVSVRTVVDWNDECLCLNCAATFPCGEACEYCGTPVAGLGDDSYLTGCILCDGRFGDDRD